jgi:hypothetical protein
MEFGMFGLENVDDYIGLQGPISIEVLIQLAQL